nr:S-layer homology domain-containing protein [Clostridia bacterium]
MKKQYGSIFARAAADCLAVAAAAALCIGVSAHSFRDVYEYDEAIDLLSGIEVIKGYSTTSFAPDDPVTRWQMALIISKLRTGRVATSVWEATGASTAFTDVQASRHYPAAINYAHNNGIIVGRTAEIFDPDANISVQDGITMCVRALGYPRSSYDSGYPNSYISKGKELGLLEGLYNLSYTATLSRGQTAQMLYNALFAPTYSGATLADDAFGFVDSNIVLAATENLRFDTNVKYASKGTYVFAEINDYGRLGDSFELDADMFDFDDPNEALGTMYSIRATGDFKTILSLDLVSKTLSDSRTTGLTVSSNSTVTIGGITYTPKSVRSYALEMGKTPSNKEIIIYSLNDDLITKQFSSGNLLTPAKIGGTSQGANKYYDMIAYDDNGDGYADRAFLRTYAFGQYKLENGKLAIADGNMPSAIKVTGKTTVKDGDYVLYSYDSQTKTLDILKILTKIEGTLSAYSSTNSTVTVDNVNYYLGWDEVKGADVATVAKDIKALSSVSGRKITGYADTDNKVIFMCEMMAEELSLEGTYYSTNLAMITGYNWTTAYDTYTGNVNTQAQYFPVVYFNNDTTTPYIVNTIDGTAANTSNISQLASLGDLVTYTVVGQKVTNNSGSPAFIYSVDLKDCSNKASKTTSSTNTLLYTSTSDETPDDSSAYTLTIYDAATITPFHLGLSKDAAMY